jgi:hypothetical protein
MSASSVLPVELWQTIFRYAISVFGFLDPDAFEGVVLNNLINDQGIPINDEATYWSSEQTRNTLQRVCTFWDNYLRNFEHRFVRLWDILHDDVSPDMLTKAIRVSFSQNKCSCHQYNGDEFGSFCWSTMHTVDSMGMQIVDFVGGSFRVTDILQLPLHFAKVEVFIGSKCRYGSSFADLMSLLPSVRNLYGDSYDGINNDGHPTSFRSRSLATLSLRHRTGKDYGAVTWELPSLHHLMLYASSREPMTAFIADAVVPTLRAVGSQLRALYLYHKTVKEVLPRELWELCPRLHTLRSGMALIHPPPPFHPIHTLFICEAKQLETIQRLPEWPNLHRIVVHPSYSSWATLKFYAFSNLLARRDVRLEDGAGLTMEEYVRQMAHTFSGRMGISGLP